VSEKDAIAAAVARLHLPDLSFAAVRPFFAAAARGGLTIPRCAHCKTWVWYPQALCPSCGGGEIAWRPVSGSGRIFTWVRVHRSFLPGFADRVPYVTALVELDEDPSLRVPAIVVADEQHYEPSIGARVEVCFERVSASPAIVVPRFRIREPGASQRMT
jgi:hypothetical protein